jgi:hypothetical protein
MRGRRRHRRSANGEWMVGLRRRWRRPSPSRTWTAVLIATAAVVAAIVGAVTVAGGSAQAPIPERPSGLADCRADPLTHVHDPLRLDLLSECAAIKGRIRSIRLNGGYNDVKVTVEVAASDVRFLRPANHGEIVVDVIGTDLGTVLLPPIGSTATFYGAWVVDKATKAVSLHPSWRVVPAEPTTRVVEAGSAAHPSKSDTRPLHEGQTLTVALDQPAKVGVGQPVVAKVRATWLKQQVTTSTGPGPARTSPEVRTPASQVRLFQEITTVTGKGVRWRARTTNTQGTASARLNATLVPGQYQLTVYAYADGQTAQASATFVVKGR